MSNLVSWTRKNVLRSAPWQSIPFDAIPALLNQFQFNGLGYGSGLVQTMTPEREKIPQDYTGFIQQAYKSSGAVFAVMLTRAMLFSEARFQYRTITNGRPGKLFGTQDLKILEKPGPNATTGSLLTRAINDVDLAGNFFAIRVPNKAPGATGMRIARLRPDWVTMVLGSVNDPSVSGFDPTAELLGYIYEPGGPASGMKPQSYLPEEVAHWAPIPDPAANYRGMSWIQPVITEMLSDKAMTAHKLAYFENGASPNLVVTLDASKLGRETFKDWVDIFESEHEGVLNAYKTLYLGNGSTATVVGANLKELDYAVVQGHGESRIAAAGGVPSIIVGFSEGLEASTYSNFGQARRAFADGTMSPLWRSFCASISQLVVVPGGSELWYDTRDIPFLRADQQDQAAVQTAKASAILSLVNAGYDPQSVVDAIEADDFSLLTHTGLFSVQLQKAGSNDQNGDQKSQEKPAATDDSAKGDEGDDAEKALSNGHGAKDRHHLAALRGIGALLP